MTITTQITWSELISQYDDELDDLQDAYDELTEQARDEYGADWQDTPLPDDPEAVADDKQRLWVYQQQTERLDESAKSIQQRRHNLERLKDEYGDGDFEIKMLTGAETMDIETELRMLAQKQDMDVEDVQIRRNDLTVNKATVDAPDGIPREDDSPTPSECPHALTLALWEQIQTFNNAGDTDFTAAGLGGDSPTDPTDASSAPPTPSTPSSPDSAE
jgi:hypothetical protein